MAKPSYYTETRSSDIAFCKGDCKNKMCSRNMDGEVFEHTYKGWYSCSEFCNHCKDYIK